MHADEIFTISVGNRFANNFRSITMQVHKCKINN